jgi:hypothetical protein
MDVPRGVFHTVLPLAIVKADTDPACPLTMTLPATIGDASAPSSGGRLMFHRADPFALEALSAAARRVGHPPPVGVPTGTDDVATGPDDVAPGPDEAAIGPDEIAMGPDENAPGD